MVEFDDHSSYQGLSHLISMLKKISEEELRQVVAERVESMSLDHTKSETSPEKSQTAYCIEVSEPSSKPLSDLNSESDTDYEDVIEFLRRLNAANAEKEDSKVVTDGVSREKTSHGHISSSSRAMARPRTRASERYRSNTCVEPAVVQSCDADPEYSLSYIRGSKNRRPMNLEEGSRKKRKAVARSQEVEPIQMVPPEWLLNVMRREGEGYDPKLISTRKFFQSDLDTCQGRLSVPLKQVKTPDFFTDEETRIIDQFVAKTRTNGVSVDLVDPNMNKHVLDLRKWKMTGNWYYMFVGGWNDVVAANRFKIDDFFPLWSFRSGSGKLCFALVPPPGYGGCSTSGQSGHENALPGDVGASTSGGSGHLPSPPARDSSFSSKGCSGKRSSRSS